MTVLHAGGKFNHSNYKVSGGLHGVGVSVVNALSEWLKLEIKRDGKTYYQEYRRGDPATGPGRDRRVEEDGTKVTFKPDPQIFKGTGVLVRDPDPAAQGAVVLNRGLTITIRDERADKSHEFNFEGGISQFVADLNTSKTTVPRQADPVLGRGRRDAGRHRAAVERFLPGRDLLLHQQHQEQGRRHAPDRLPRGADAHR
jgi:DNA gyrase subunit B